MPRISRQDRADLARRAARIRLDGQRTGRTVQAIADEIVRQLPPVTPLEARRLAFGWSRPVVVDAIGAFYVANGLAPPGLTTAMLCRWEHGDAAPNPDYADALAQVYQAPMRQLGVDPLRSRQVDWYGRPYRPPQLGASMVEHSALSAVTDSVALQLEVEGPSGGPQTREHLDRALEYFTVHYGDYPPAEFTAEVHRCRAMVVSMLSRDQADADRAELRRLAGWLSALLGDLAFSLSDHSGAHIHLGTGARLGVDVGDRRLAGWSLGAQSMVAFFQERHTDALELARQAGEYAFTPLHKAQIAAWCMLRPLARMGESDSAREVFRVAQHEMDAAPAEESGRFGFDRAEFHQHLAEASLDLGDTIQARRHARHSLDMKVVGSGGWAAATAILARTHAAEHNGVDACALADSVLDAVPPTSLRESTRRRLAALLTDLDNDPRPGPHVQELRDRVSALPSHTAPQRTSPEPNGN